MEGGRENRGKEERPQLGPCHSPALLAASATASAGALSKVRLSTGCWNVSQLACESILVC